MDTQLAYGSTVNFSTFTAEIVSFSIGGEKEQVETTHLLSPGKFREFIGGLINPGELAMSVNFDPGTPDPRKLADATLEVDWGDGSKWTWPSATTLNYEITENVGEKRSAEVSFQLSGELVQS